MYAIIAGGGKVGWNLARELMGKGHEVTLIESDRNRYLTIEQELEHVAQYGDATELWVLERAGIQRAELVVAGTGAGASTTRGTAAGSSSSASSRRSAPPTSSCA
jgi:trk system potassium uptake protein TrkA